MNKLKRFFKALKLRMSLLRIWFMKNIMIFIKVACIVCLICIFTGVITAETPILGTIIYPIFAPLADEINAIIKEKEIDGLMTFFSILISVLFSISMFAIKARNIAQSDIKSPKLKYALIQANLYFNENGKLVKKVEKATGTDINMDGKIDESESEGTERKGIFKEIISAFQEFKTIMNADLNKDAEDDDDAQYRKVIEESKLENAEDAVSEIDEILKGGLTNIVSDKGQKIADKKIEETLNNSEISDEEKSNKISLFTKVKEWFISLKNKRKARKELKKKEKEEAEILANNMDKDSVSEKAAVAKKEKKAKTVETPVVQEEVKSTKEKNADEFLKNLQNRKK